MLRKWREKYTPKAPDEPIKENYAESIQELEKMEYLETLFGKKNTIYAVVHNDEHTPHMHFGFVAITEDNRICAKEIIKRNILRQIQEELPEHLQKAGFDIERGEGNSEAVHHTVKQDKADMEKEKAELATVIQV